MIYYVDMFLIFFYRVFETPIFGYLFGTFFLSLICVLIGRMTHGLLAGWNRKWIYANQREMVHMHNLSLKALSFKNKTAYRACNREANDAFGKYFFGQIAMGMSTLWPVPFALAWLDLRFSEVAFLFPGTGHSVGYLATFIPLYILTNMSYRLLKRNFPMGASVGREQDKHMEKMMTLADLIPETARHNRQTL